MIDSYNNYYLSPNGIQSGNRRWYGLAYLVYKRAGSHRARPRNDRVAVSTLLGRVTFWEYFA